MFLIATGMRDDQRSIHREKLVNRAGLGCGNAGGDGDA